MADLEALQRFLSQVEMKELEDMKYRMNLRERSPDSPFENGYRLVDRYYFDGKIFTPSYFQVKRSPEDDLFLEQIDKEDVQRCEQNYHFMRNTVKDEVSWMLSSHPIFTSMWESVKKMAECFDDLELYQNTIRGAATLMFSLYSCETLFKLHHSRTHQTQLNKLWKKLQCSKTSSLNEFCSAISRHKFSEEYSLVTQGDLDSFIWHYVDGLLYPETRGVPYVGFTPQHKKKDMFHEIHEVVVKMKYPERTECDLDGYSRLLMKLVSEDSWDEEQELLGIMGIINSPYDDLKMKINICFLDMIKLEQCRLKDMRKSVKRPLYQLCYGSHLSQHEPRVLVCKDVWEVIEVADFRREALGGRFIKRNHLIWAFYELGFGLPCEITKNLNIEDEDHPPYHIYLASIRLAYSLGEEILQLQHFIFAVLYLKDIPDYENLATEMEEHFRAFMRGAALDGVTRPNANGAALDGVTRPNANADKWLKYVS